MSLDEPLGWKPAKYDGNKELQDDYLEELNVSTYNGFKDLLFWDVLQGITKIYLVKLEMKAEKQI